MIDYLLGILSGFGLAILVAGCIDYADRKSHAEKAEREALIETVLNAQNATKISDSESDESEEESASSSEEEECPCATHWKDYNEYVRARSEYTKTRKIVKFSDIYKSADFIEFLSNHSCIDLIIDVDPDCADVAPDIYVNALLNYTGDCRVYAPYAIGGATLLLALAAKNTITNSMGWISLPYTQSAADAEHATTLINRICTKRGYDSEVNLQLITKFVKCIPVNDTKAIVHPLEMRELDFMPNVNKGETPKVITDYIKYEVTLM